MTRINEDIPGIDRLLRRHDVEQLIGLGRSAIYAAMAAGTFPRPARIGSRAVAWRESDLRAWMASLPTVGGAK